MMIKWKNNSSKDSSNAARVKKKNKSEQELFGNCFKIKETEIRLVCNH